MWLGKHSTAWQLNLWFTQGDSLEMLVSWHLQRSLFHQRWKMFSLLKNSAWRSLRRLGRNLSLLAQRVCFTLGTHHISCLFIKRTVRSIGCGEVVRPQAKNTFMRPKLYAHCMQRNDLVRINVSSISRLKDTEWRCVAKAWWVRVSVGHKWWNCNGEEVVVEPKSGKIKTSRSTLRTL